MKLRLLQKHTFMLKQDRIFKNYLFTKPLKVWKPINSCMPSNIVKPDVDLWFTDGSGINDCFGAGVY